MICEDDRPFALIYTTAFVNLLHELNPNYKIPSFETLKNFLDVHLATSKKELIQLISTLNYYSITLDLWTSIAHHHYIIYTLHYIKDFKIHKRILACEEVPNIVVDHLVIVRFMETLMVKYNLKKELIIKIISDAGANVKKAIEIFGGGKLHCLGHVINLVCQDALTKIEKIREKTRIVIKYFNQSSNAMGQFREIQKSDNLENDFADVIYALHNEVLTRWNSTFYMFNRIILLSDCINDALDLCGKSELAFTPEELDIITGFMKLLEPLEKATRILSGDTYVTASLIIPTLKECILDIKEQTIENDEVIKFQKELLEGLSNRCEQFFIDDNLR